MTFKDQTVVVTGASRGIGRAIAEAFLEEGARVIGTATSQASFGDLSSGIEFVAADFSQREELDRVIDWMQTSASLDVLVNNAGINRILPLDRVSDADFSEVFDVDLRAPYRLSQAAARVMASRGGGRIVNIASIWSIVTKAQRTLYTAAKSGLVGMTRAMAVELAPAKVLVNAVSPGFVLTDLTQRSLTPAEMTRLSTQIPAGRMAEPEEIARVVRFLCSDQNTYITGQNITVDGGFTLT